MYKEKKIKVSDLYHTITQQISQTQFKHHLMLSYFGNYDINIHFMLTFNLESTDVHLESTVPKLSVQMRKKDVSNVYDRIPQQTSQTQLKYHIMLSYFGKYTNHGNF